MTLKNRPYFEHQERDEKAARELKLWSSSPYGIAIGQIAEKEIKRRYKTFNESSFTMNSKEYKQFSIHRVDFTCASFPVINVVDVSTDINGVVVMLSLQYEGRKFCQIHPDAYTKYPVEKLESPFKIATDTIDDVVIHVGELPEKETTYLWYKTSYFDEEKYTHSKNILMEYEKKHGLSPGSLFKRSVGVSHE